MTFPVPTALGKAREELLSFPHPRGRCLSLWEAQREEGKMLAPPQPTRATTPRCRHDGGKGESERASNEKLTAQPWLGRSEFLLRKKRGRSPPPYNSPRPRLHEPKWMNWIKPGGGRVYHAQSLPSRKRRQRGLQTPAWPRSPMDLDSLPCHPSPTSTI